MITKISIKNHKQHKIELLKLIAAVPHIPSASEKIENISKSDWFLSSDYPRVYREYFFNVLKSWFKHMENKYKTPARISNYWFQQYSGASMEEHGFSEEYVEWLEAKVKRLLESQ